MGEDFDNHLLIKLLGCYGINPYIIFEGQKYSYGPLNLGSPGRVFLLFVSVNVIFPILKWLSVSFPEVVNVVGIIYKV